MIEFLSSVIWYHRIQIAIFISVIFSINQSYIAMHQRYANLFVAFSLYQFFTLMMTDIDDEQNNFHVISLKTERNAFLRFIKEFLDLKRKNIYRT